jgi:hypothetical protein
MTKGWISPNKRRRPDAADQPPVNDQDSELNDRRWEVIDRNLLKKLKGK